MHSILLKYGKIWSTNFFTSSYYNCDDDDYDCDDDDAERDWGKKIICLITHNLSCQNCGKKILK